MQSYPGLYALETDRFRLEDLFFSRTDKRGVIQSGNATFQYISGYEWSDLVGAPHKIVRHPDMPKCVFYMLWEAIQKNEPIGGYVINRTRQGQPYWVYAVMMPWDDGYISIRLKPTSKILEKLKPIYEKLRRAEEQDGVSPEDGAKVLLAELKEMGFSDYNHFMSDALIAETMDRISKLGKARPHVISALQNIAEAVTVVEESGGTVEMLFARTEQIPYNMRLQAGRLEGADGPISVISDNHRQMSQSLSHSLSGFRDAAELGAGPLRVAMFVSAIASLIPEVMTVYSREPTGDTDSRKLDLDHLANLSDQYGKQSRSEVSQLADKARRFARICRDMRRMMSGLEMTRIMCKIERSKAQGDTEGLDEIVNRLQSSEQDLNRVMTEIEDAVRVILETSDQLLRRTSQEAA
ncbi:MAG: PAS domain-containing protein [Paracoccaceae bacterium]